MYADYTIAPPPPYVLRNWVNVFGKYRRFQYLDTCLTEATGKTGTKISLLLWSTVSENIPEITEKVKFNIASEASYVYILSGQK